MKTRTTFEESDFNGSCQMVVRDSFPRGSKAYEFGMSVAYKIGYIVTNTENATALISLSDGMVIGFKSKAAMVDHLNKDEAGFRVLEIEEYVEMVRAQGSRFPQVDDLSHQNDKHPNNANLVRLWRTGSGFKKRQEDD